MYTQPLTTPRSANTHAVHAISARLNNLDAGTYQATDRDAGRGYGRSQGYAAPRPYAGGLARPLFRIF